MTEVTKGVTPRGFSNTEIPFHDYRTTPQRVFTVQASSIATERKVWVGAEPMELEHPSGPWMLTRAHLNEEEARAVRDALTEWLDNA